ncbi:MAG: DUF2156 domain-containing protein [Clostridiales bacterium]|jgi:hypothetical protein|nr:DUF2156 domain-containing protein [Clostridiales bacterium]
MLDGAYYRMRRERTERVMLRLSPSCAFEPVTPRLREPWLHFQPRTTVSSRSLLSVCAYAQEDAIYWREDAQSGYLLVLLLEGDNSLLAFPPIGEYRPARFESSILRLRRIFDWAGEPFRLAYMSELEAQWLMRLPGYEVWSDPGESDYLYLISELTRFDGPENANRRMNHARFLRRHGASTLRIETPGQMDDCRLILDDWCSQRDCAGCGFRCVKEVALRALRDLGRLSATGGIMYMDGEPEALMLLGDMGGGMADMLSIIARHRHAGLSGCLIDQVCRLCASGAKYLNFEEDIGIPGLRRFKESLHPLRLLPKYRARAIGDGALAAEAEGTG